MAHTIRFIHIFIYLYYNLQQKVSICSVFYNMRQIEGNLGLSIVFSPFSPFPYQFSIRNPPFVLFREGEEEEALPREISRKNYQEGLNF